MVLKSFLNHELFPCEKSVSLVLLNEQMDPSALMEFFWKIKSLQKTNLIPVQLIVSQLIKQQKTEFAMKILLQPEVNKNNFQIQKIMNQVNLWCQSIQQIYKIRDCFQQNGQILHASLETLIFQNSKYITPIFDEIITQIFDTQQNQYQIQTIKHIIKQKIVISISKTLKILQEMIQTNTDTQYFVRFIRKIEYLINPLLLLDLINYSYQLQKHEYLLSVVQLCLTNKSFFSMLQKTKLDDQLWIFIIKQLHHLNRKQIQDSDSYSIIDQINDIQSLNQTFEDQQDLDDFEFLI